MSSPELEVNLLEGQAITLECIGQRNPFVAAIHLLVRRQEYLTLRVVAHDES